MEEDCKDLLLAGVDSADTLCDSRGDRLSLTGDRLSLTGDRLSVREE